jgi:hypothetical protein
MQNRLRGDKLARAVRPALVALALSTTLALSGCDTLGGMFGSGDTADNDPKKTTSTPRNNSTRSSVSILIRYGRAAPC